MEFARSVEMGEVLHMAKSGRLIIKVRQGVELNHGHLLLDEAGKRVGKIVELIGPVRAPYASAIPLTDRTSRIAGLRVFNGGFAERKQREGTRPRKRAR